MRNKINTKKIKKRNKILIIVLLVIICIPVSGYFTLKSSKVQTYLIKLIADNISDNLNAKFTFDEIDISFFNKIVLKNVYIEDQRKDTLLFSKKLVANIKKISRSEKTIEFNNIILSNALICFTNDSLNRLNLEFIVRAIRKKDTIQNKTKKLNLKFNSIELQQSTFRLKRFYKKNYKQKVNFSDLELTDLNIKISKLVPKKIVTLNIEELSFTDKSGFKVNNLKSKMSIHREHLRFDNISIYTPHSYINANHLYFKFNRFKEFKNFEEQIKLDFFFNSSNISILDIAYFSPKLDRIDRNFVLSGKIKGKVSDLKGKDINIKYGKQTEFSGEFDIYGLPKLDETFIYVELDKLTIIPEDIENSPLPKTSKKIKLPPQIKNLGVMSYKGNFTGFINDFVAYGSLKTELGIISSDILIKPNKNNKLDFKGNLKTKDFDLGKLLGNTKNFNSLTMNVKVNGSLSKNKDIEANLDGIINSIEINKYNYQNLNLSGDLTDKKFDGLITINDPNINFEFLGRFDFSEEIPVFDFSTILQKANLYKLNFNSDTSSRLSLSLLANFTGDKIDNLNGKVQFLNVSFFKQDENLKIDDFELTANSIKNIKQIALKSDYIDGEVFGKFKYTSLLNSVSNILSNYLPAIKNFDSLSYSADTLNNFTFNLNLKSTREITNFFIPDLKISDNAHFTGKYNAIDYDISFDGFAKNFAYKKNLINNLQVKASSNKKNIILNIESDKIRSNKFLEVSRFSLHSICLSDSINTNLTWITPKDSLQSHISTITHFQKNNNSNKPSINIDFIPSIIYLNYSPWKINDCNINVDSTFVSFNKFKFSNNEESIELDGAISEKEDDELKFSFNNLNISKFNFLTLKNRAQLYGILDGKATLSNLYSIPFFFSDLKIDSLAINKNNIGHANISSTWNNYDKLIQLEANIQNNNNKTLDINGSYSPKDNSLSYFIDLNNFQLNAFHPFVSKTFSNMDGVIEGKLTLTGYSKAPVLTGELNISDAIIEVDYLKTKYTFDAIIPFTENAFVFNKVEAYDINGNKAIVNGTINHKNLKDISYDLNINATNFKTLNTLERDNDLFYGKAFTTGIIEILGDSKNLIINASAKTEKNTQIFIPLSDDEEVSETDFITFINNKKEEEFIFEEKYDVNLSGIELNFDLEITPDAEAQIIFDSKIGDIIKGKGSGDLKLEIKTPGDFKMYGDFTFEEGNYLFTLQNVINKRFEVKPDGVISWNGDPYDATIDIEAVYKLKASIYDLILDAEEGHKKRIPVECQLFMTDKLENPTLRFDIAIPTSDASTQNMFKNSISSEDNLKKQFLALIVINSFIPDPNRLPNNPNDTQESKTGLGITSAAVTTSELLSNQLSNWLSQISNDFDIGVNYRPGDEVTTDEIELALSTQVLNDRVNINGNVDVAGNKESNTNEIVGDFNVDIKINKSGKLRLKAFTKANDKLIYEGSQNTQGVGILYREDFDTFKELFASYWNSFFKKEEE